MKIGPVIINISECTAGIYLRWWYNGWHYFNFQNGYDIQMNTESMGTQVTRMFSRISKIERPTRLKAKYSYQVTLEGITSTNITGFTGLLLAERVEQYEDATWYEVDITRGDHLIKNPDTDAYILNFEITRKDLSGTSSVIHNSTLLYVNDTLCDLDEDEVIPINKQVNDIAEMQDRQSDYTAQFRIRKTRSMMALFELSGEVGANTTFPYEKQSCRLVQDSVEIITDGELIIDNVDNNYYYVSVYSGNLSFFKSIDGLKITDLTLASTNHTWDITTMAGTHAADLNYLYPLLEPSDDGGLVNNVAPDNDIANIYGGYIWPFVKVKAIWDEIFSNAGYTVSGDILTNDLFLAMFIPISSLEIPKATSNKYLYSVWWNGNHTTVNDELLAFTGAVLINGDELFRTGYYILPYSGTYKITVLTATVFGFAPTLSVYLNGVYQGPMELTNIGLVFRTWTYEVDGTAGQPIAILTTAILYYSYNVSITEITDPLLAYSSAVTPADNLPDISQTEFIKMICNQFGLVPDAKPRDRKINFWNYDELYDNIPIARSWEKYLSETDDEVTFKYGDYAQRNYLRYKDSDDVLLDQGVGIMQIDDATLQDSKEVIQIPLATCDEVTILVDVVVSRIDMNKWDDKTSLYIPNDKIDPRIVFMSNVDYSATSPVYEKTLRLRSTYSLADPLITTVDIDTPKKVSSLEISFSNLVVNYASLSRMLTKTNLRTSKFNLPVFEVAGLRYNVPIYLPQYKAYFYVNKINNYVFGQLCGIELIKL